jgi:hypothetical protein
MCGFHARGLYLHSSFPFLWWHLLASPRKILCVISIQSFDDVVYHGSLALFDYQCTLPTLSTCNYFCLVSCPSHEIFCHPGFKNTHGWHNEAGSSKDTSSNSWLHNCKIVCTTFCLIPSMLVHSFVSWLPTYVFSW